MNNQSQTGQTVHLLAGPHERSMVLLQALDLDPQLVSSHYYAGGCVNLEADEVVFVVGPSDDFHCAALWRAAALLFGRVLDDRQV